MMTGWLYCQNCEEVIQAHGGYVEGEHHSCWNHVPQTGKDPKLLRLTPERVRKEIEECRSEIARASNRIGHLLRYEKNLKNV